MNFVAIFGGNPAFFGLDQFKLCNKRVVEFGGAARGKNSTLHFKHMHFAWLSCR